MSNMGDGEWQIVGRRRRNSQKIKVKRGTPTRCSANRGGLTADHDSNIDPSTRIADNECEDDELRDKAEIKEHIEKQARLVTHLQGLLKQTFLWEDLKRQLQTALLCMRLNFSSTSEEYPSVTQVEDSRRTPSQVCRGESLSTTSKRAGMDGCGLFPSSNGSCVADLSIVNSTSRGPEVRRQSPPSGQSQGVHSQQGFAGRKSKSSNSIKSHPPSERYMESDNCPADEIGDLFEGRKGFREIVCYGLGSFSKEIQPKYQLALALCLRELLLPDVNREPAEECYDDGEEGPSGSKPVHPKLLVFDPILGNIEKAILTKLGCGVIEMNEKGKRCCCTPSRPEDARPTMLHCRATLFFMPHCPKPLYSNVLWANWSFRGLGSLMILGNSLAKYRELMSLSGHADDVVAQAIDRAGALIEEVEVHACPPGEKIRWKVGMERLPVLDRAFNDLCLSYSPLDRRLSAAGQQALSDRPEEFHDSDGDLESRIRKS